LTENQWRSLGIQQSRGWQHYMIHPSEPHVLIFKRPLQEQKSVATTNETCK
jgi:cyclin-dependent kinase regulatory subunit CKS1